MQLSVQASLRLHVLVVKHPPPPRLLTFEVPFNQLAEAHRQGSHYLATEALTRKSSCWPLAPAIEGCHASFVRHVPHLKGVPGNMLSLAGRTPCPQHQEKAQSPPAATAAAPASAPATAPTSAGSLPLAAAGAGWPAPLAVCHRQQARLPCCLPQLRLAPGLQMPPL